MREREGSGAAIVVRRRCRKNECSRNDDALPNRIALVVFSSTTSIFSSARFRALARFDRSCSFALAHNCKPLLPSEQERGEMKDHKLQHERLFRRFFSISFSLRAIEIVCSTSLTLVSLRPTFLLLNTAPLGRLRALPLRPQPLDGNQPQQHGQDAQVRQQRRHGDDEGKRKKRNLLERQPEDCRRRLSPHQSAFKARKETRSRFSLLQSRRCRELSVVE